MRLALAALASFRKTYPGHMYRGKHRKRPYATEEAIAARIKFLKMEEQNMFYLRHPYLTLEQSWGHSQELGKQKAFIREMHLMKLNRNAKPSVTIEERYDMLRNNDVWD
ncbi:large ribosomal subunit protein mL63-like [Macrobrachium nipponense]|uniref:large ribosomal subunit protein mL63-like n=1 Tax=Macrobrachium nipponense TaxID=159736 RepID=UPI0030C7DFBA